MHYVTQCRTNQRTETRNQASPGALLQNYQPKAHGPPMS